MMGVKENKFEKSLIIIALSFATLCLFLFGLLLLWNIPPQHTNCELKGTVDVLNSCNAEILHLRSQFNVDKGCFIVLSDYGSADMICNYSNPIKYKMLKGIYGKIDDQLLISNAR